MFVDDPTAVLRHLSRAVKPGGIVAFQEQVADARGVSPERQPLLASTLELFSEAFERSGARLNIGLELYSRMLDAGLEPTPEPIAEIGMHMGDDAPGARRWALFARSMLPKIVEYGLATEAHVDADTLEQRLRGEFLEHGGMIPLTWLMVAQWARTPSTEVPQNPRPATSARGGWVPNGVPN
jgi:hypothetical protein